MMKKKIRRFLWCSFVVVAIICIIVFVYLTVFLTRYTKRTVSDVSQIYMSEINLQLRQKFDSIINLRIQQVEGIVKRTPANKCTYGSAMLEELRLSAEIRNFTYLGFLTEDGRLKSIYGEDIEIDNEQDVKDSLEEDDTFIERGFNKEEEKVLLLGTSAKYPMEDGSKSLALVAGVPMEYLDQALFLHIEGANVYSHIINKDGQFVIRNSDIYKNNYFQWVEQILEKYNGKTPTDYTRELKEAMDKDEDYYITVSIDGEQRIMYCSPLGNSTWYLITVMPKGILDYSITKLDNVRLGMMLGSSAVIMITMVFIFVSYLKLSGQQMKELDKARREAVHANHAKSEFLSSMSHDIRTPMNAIIGMTEIALKNVNDQVRLNDCLKKVQLSSKHLLGLINDVLDMSKIESGKMTLKMNPISLRETMDDIVNIMQPQVKARNQYFDIFIQRIISEDVYCDSMRLNQVLLNLLSNAVKFTSEGGRINIHVFQEPSSKGEEYIRTHFVVEDNGIGMSEEFQQKIWDSFSRENTEQVQNITGTGLGMAITKSIINLMGGEIELQSELGKGSKFHITLDLKQAIKEEDMKLPPWRILVVDDNDQLCLSAVSNLEELGVCAEWTQDGRKAVQMIEERHNNNDDYHFVLIDWKMPNMDGLQTIHEIQKKIGKKVPIFLISAYDWNDIEVEASSAEIEGFISKPLFKSTLYTRLIEYVNGKKNSSSEFEQESSQEVDFTGKRILVAEDIEINWEIANEILTSFGLNLEHAVNGKECVEKFEQSEFGYYDLILMDIRMPIMNGYDATKNIRLLEERPDRNIPIIAMTADAFSDDVQYCLNCGMDAHIPKPLDIKELIRVLQKFLKGKK